MQYQRLEYFPRVFFVISPDNAQFKHIVSPVNVCNDVNRVAARPTRPACVATRWAVVETRWARRTRLLLAVTAPPRSRWTLWARTRLQWRQEDLEVHAPRRPRPAGPSVVRSPPSIPAPCSTLRVSHKSVQHFSTGEKICVISFSSLPLCWPCTHLPTKWWN